LVREDTTTVRRILNPVNPASRHRWSPDQRTSPSLSQVRNRP